MIGVPVWASATAVLGQSAFPRPKFKLFDVKHQEPKPEKLTPSDYQVQEGRVFVRVLPSATRTNVLSFSPDGTLLAAGKDYGRVVVWDVSRKAFFLALDTGQGSVVGLAISPDNQLMATVTRGAGGIALWHLPDGKLVHQLPTTFPAQFMAFTRGSSSLVIFETANAHVYVMDAATGDHKEDLTEEHWPALSSDGNTLMSGAGSELVLRRTDDWKILQRLPKPTPYVRPTSLDPQSDTYIYVDPTDEHSFVAVHLSTGALYPNPRHIDLPRFKEMKPYFASLDPKTGLVFGYTGDQLWAWNYETGKDCVSETLPNATGALSANGHLVAKAIDEGDNNKVGVALWETESVARACKLK